MIIRDMESMVEQYDRGRMDRRQLMTHLTALMAAAVGGGVVGGAVKTAVGQETPATSDAPAAGPTDSTFKAVEVDHIALSVTDIGRSRAFYEQHLGLRVTSHSRQSCFMQCSDGNNFLALFRADEPRMHHYCYSIDGYDPAQAVEKLEAASLKPMRQDNRVYFDDPDGLTVQVSA